MQFSKQERQSSVDYFHRNVRAFVCLATNKRVRKCDGHGGFRRCRRSPDTVSERRHLTLSRAARYSFYVILQDDVLTCSRVLARSQFIELLIASSHSHTTRTPAKLNHINQMKKSAGRTPPFLGDDDMPIPNSIAEAKYLRIGDIDQCVLIRGQHVNENPLLIMLHGGPGFSETAFWRYYNSVLEKDFTVVYWDQRGSGKSYDKSIPKETMTVEQFISDLDQVVDAVCTRCNKQQVILFGHSWGSVLGPLYAQKYPEKVSIYVGSGQLGNWAASEVLTYNYTLELAEKQKNRKALRELKKVGPPPHDCNALCTQRKWLHQLDDDTSIAFLFQMLHMLRTVPETSVWDLFGFWKVLRFSIDAMWTEVTSLNLVSFIPELAMPTFFFLGRQDHCVFPENSLEFIDNLKAPSKQVVWFEESKHEPFVDEPEKFNTLMVEMVRPVVVKKET